MSKIVEKNKPIVINKEQNTKAFVDYKYIINSEISDYSRFLLDLKWQRVKGKDYFTYQEFPVDLKTNNLSLKKRNYFILEPYDKKIIENYLIRAYSLGLLEINEKPLEVRKKLVATIPITNKTSLNSKSSTFNKAVDTTYIKSRALKAFPYMDLYRIKVINYLKKTLKNKFSLKNDTEMAFSLENIEFREKVIEYIFESIPTEYLDTEVKVLDLFVIFLNYFNSHRVITYSKSPFTPLVKDTIFRKGFVNKRMNHPEIRRFLRLTRSESYRRNLIYPFFKQREDLIYSTYNYEIESNSSTVYKKFRRDVLRNFREGKISKKDRLYLEKKLNKAIDFNELKKIKWRSN